MGKDLKLKLGEDLYRRLMERCGEDEEAVHRFVISALEKELPPTPQKSENKGSETQGLEDYLKAGKPGSRSYGIKGQGW